jgi:CheY-like chemotaxis protein
MNADHSIKMLLVVEDNDGDIDLLKAAFEELGQTFIMHIERDGDAAIRYLNEIVKGDRKEFPDLIFIDVNIPRYNGHEVLAAARQLPEFELIPILIYTSSSKSSDVTASYDKGATVHLQKSLDFDETVRKVKKLLDAHAEIYGKQA